MSYPPGLAFHGKGWRITKRIPESLRAHYGGRRFCDKKAAAVIALRWLADTAEEFARIRETGSAAKTIVPAAEVSRLVASMLAGFFDSSSEDVPLLIGAKVARVPAATSAPLPIQAQCL